MKIEIKHHVTGALLWAGEAENLKIAVVKAVFNKAYLRGAYLSGADLSGAYLRGADLSGAYLSGAYLRGADLSGAYLSGAYLSGAYLSGADLSGADLSGAYLRGADLSGDIPKFSPNTIIETGETWQVYLDEVVPALLTAGGVALSEFAESWECHKWENCPMHKAFGAFDLSGVPALLRPRAEQFIKYFDAKMIPLPKRVAK